GPVGLTSPLAVGLLALAGAVALTEPLQQSVARIQTAPLQQTVARNLATPAQFVQGHQRDDGSFAEAGSPPGAALTAWAVLGLAASGEEVAPAARNYLVGAESGLEAATDVELVAMAELALGLRADSLLARIRSLFRPGGAIGPTINSTIWGVLALRTAALPVPWATVRWLLARQ